MARHFRPGWGEPPKDGVSRGIECRRCGRGGLRWENDDGQWVLMETQYRIHKCEPRRADRDAEDDFDVVA